MSDELTIVTRLGHAGWDDHELRGVVVFDLPPGEASIADLLLRSVGVAPTSAARAVVSACVQAGLNPDPRIPAMKLVRIGSAHGSLLAGLAAGFAGLDGSYAGMSSLADAARFLVSLRQQLGEEADDARLDAALRERRRSRDGIAGFGVPGRKLDERIPWLTARLDAELEGPRPWWRLFERAGAIMARYRRQPNFGGAAAAALLDVGCDPAQVEAIACQMGLLPLLGNALEGSRQAPALLQRLPPAASVDYVGAAPRTSPRQAEACDGDEGDDAEPR